MERKKDFKELLKQDNIITNKLSNDEIDDLFDLEKILININKIYKKDRDNKVNEIKEQLNFTLNDLKIEKNIGEHYKGKVRDNFHMDDKILMVTSDRVSAFDHVLVQSHLKGQILTEIANFGLRKLKILYQII